jgi:pimeloyl-ACP methyl ester carboxylesterase
MHRAGRHRPITVAGVAASVVLLFVLSACSTSGQGLGASSSTEAPTSSTSSAGSSTTAGSTPTPKIAWHSCGSRECGTLRVPLDYSKPNGRSIELGLVKIPARKKSSYKGPLLVNPGGPGASGIELAESLPWSSAIRDHFDVIGFDPRGVGESTKITCGIPVEQLYHVDYVPDSQAELQQLLNVSNRYVDDCDAKYASVLPHLGTRDVARDMDSIRRGLGVDKIDYLGFSYGTSIGQAYVGMFPTHVRAMVLDGIVDLNQSGIQSAQGQGIAFEKLLDGFEAWCTARSGCAAGPDPKALVQRVYDKTQRGTIPAPEADRPFGPGEFQLGVIAPLYQGQAGYASLASALAAADHGDGSRMVDLADSYLSAGGTEIYFAVSCLDQSWPRDPNAIVAGGKAISAQAPLLGEATVTDYIRCALWPTPPQPLHTPTTSQAPPIVVISTTDDPATPYENGVRLARALPHAMLLSHTGSAHTIYGQGDSCVDDIVESYLVDLTPLPANAHCD